MHRVSRALERGPGERRVKALPRGWLIVGLALGLWAVLIAAGLAIVAVLT